jgi:HlyD family secretion protein
MRIAGIPVSRWIKRIAVAAALLAIVGIVAWSLIPRPVPVEVATVRRATLIVTVDEDGRARVHDRYVVTAPLGGTLARIELHAGDTVRAGDVLARISPAPAPLLDAGSRAELEGRIAIAQARGKQATAAVQRAERNATYTESERVRARTLADQGALPGVEADRAQLLADVAKRDLDSARFDAAIAADELATARAIARRLVKGGAEEVAVQAPVAGRILRLLWQSEGAVAPMTPLLEIGDPARLEIVVDVLTADAVEIRPGADVEIVGWGGAPLHAVVRLVEPSATTRISALGVEEQRVAIVADLVDPPARWASLGDGWRVEARITTWRGADVVTVPVSALFRDGEQWAVYVVEAGRARLRHVEIGHRNDDAAEVRGGLTEGQRVILHPSERVSDGTRVAAGS